MSNKIVLLLTLLFFAQIEAFTVQIATALLPAQRNEDRLRVLEPDEEYTGYYFGVFDGHASSHLVAQYLANNLHIFINKQVENTLEEKIYNGCTQAEEFLLVNSFAGGSTATFGFLEGSTLTVGNVGDSRAVACVNGKAVELTRDHKPDNPDEWDRVHTTDPSLQYYESLCLGPAMCHVESRQIIDTWPLTRAFGDIGAKSAGIPLIAVPDITTYKISHEYQFLLFASDGVWDVLSSQEVVIYLHELLSEGLALDDVIERLTAAARQKQKERLSQKKGKLDDIALVLVVFDHNQEDSVALGEEVK